MKMTASVCAAFEDNLIGCVNPDHFVYVDILNWHCQSKKR